MNKEIIQKEQPTDARFARNLGMYGEEGQKTLLKKIVLLAGLGGVGSFAFEALVRSGVGTLIIIDGDTVDETNLNRQLIATSDTVGREKTAAAKERAASIRPNVTIIPVQERLSEAALRETLQDLPRPDLILDAVDDVPVKIELACYAYENGIPAISAMGCANKQDPTKFKVADIYDTTVCPLAKKVRKELKKREIPTLKVVYSNEVPKKTGMLASLPYVPSVCGLIMAQAAIEELLGEMPDRSR